MRDYQREVTNYTRGRGRLSLSLKGYEPCHNQDEVVEAMGYDFDGDLADRQDLYSVPTEPEWWCPGIR